MDTIRLPSDFKEFLRLLNSHDVEYLLIGGIAVAFHGYPRTTGDMDIWIAATPPNAQRTASVLRAFGFDSENLETLCMTANKVIRMGVPPIRIEVLTNIDGVEFELCYARKLSPEIDGVTVSMISLDDLKTNKRASARTNDLDDLAHLP